MAKILVLGASGRVGSQVIQALDRNHDGVEVVMATSRPEVAARWREEGRSAVVLDLNSPETFAHALRGAERLFLLTGYTSDMLHQSKMLVDAAVVAGVAHIVHLGVFTSRKDPMPHFNWHDLVESYIEASGIAWTHLHPNVITESVLVRDPPVTETGVFTVLCGDKPQGWVCTADIAAVAATVLREGPEKHAGANYWMSIEVLTGPEVAAILTAASGRQITCNVSDPSELEAALPQMNPGSVRAYMESAVMTMRLTQHGQMSAQTALRDDVLKVVGRPGTTMKQWAQQYFASLHR